MFSLALVILSLNADRCQSWNDFAAQITTAGQMVRGRWLGIHIKKGMTGGQVKAILGEPTSIRGWTLHFGGAHHAGRDHWGACQSAVLAGGGIRGGQIYGASDARGAYPRDDPVRPQDIHATMYQALGISPAS